MLYLRQVEKELCPWETLFLYALLSLCVGEMHRISFLACSEFQCVWTGRGTVEEVGRVGEVGDMERREGVVDISCFEGGQEHSFDCGLFIYFS